MTTAQYGCLEHPCKKTCSGWTQGYDRGVQAERARAEHLIAALKDIKFDVEEGFREGDRSWQYRNLASHALAEYRGEGEVNRRRWQLVGDWKHSGD